MSPPTEARRAVHGQAPLADRDPHRGAAEDAVGRYVVVGLLLARGVMA
jgi:hypothetical protein